MQSSFSNAWSSNNNLTWVLTALSCSRLAYQVEPISTRRFGASTFMYVVMPAMLPSASKTVHGIMAPDACRPRRRSISLDISSARGTKVYQSFHSSPSLTASVRPSQWSCDKGLSCAWGPCRDIGSSQGIMFSFSVRHCEERKRRSNPVLLRGFLDCFACARNDGTLSSLVEKIQRETRPRPVHRDQLAFAGQCDVGGLQVGPAEGDIGGDAVAGRHLLDDAAIRCDHRNAARNQRGHADIAGSFHRERIEHLVTAEARDRLCAFAAIDHVARADP